MEPRAPRLSLAKPTAAPRPKFVSLRAERRAEQQARHMRRQRFDRLWSLIKALARIIEFMGMIITFGAIGIVIFELTHNWPLTLVVNAITSGFWILSSRK